MLMIVPRLIRCLVNAHEARRRTWLAVLASGLACAGAQAGVALLGVQYKPDQAFPEHECFWHESQFPGSCGPSSPMGASIHVFLRNDGSSPVTVQDVVFAGFSLNQVLALHYQVEKRQPASIWLAGLNSTELQTLLAAGEPVWFKTDPATIAAGGVAQVVVRLRQTPQVSSLSVDVVHSAGTTGAVVPVQPTQPALAGASFSSDLTTAYLYWRRVSGGSAPTSIMLDGTNVTASTTTVGDPNVNLAASVVQLAEPPSSGSLHIFQGIYGDDLTAGAAVRAWTNDFIYATWGARSGASGDYAAARAWIDEATNHFVNALEVQGGSDALKEYLKTAEGKQYAADRGYGCVIDANGLWGCTTPRMWFIRDEPDNADTRVENLPADKMVGSLAQMAVQTGETLRAAYPAAPTAINLDGAYKPLNWYNYGQVPDVMMSDPYFQVRLANALWSDTNRIPLYSKATYIYAVSQVAQSAAEPNPLHIILYSCEYDHASGSVLPFAPPATKRMEVYYALAAGAKGMAYWWFRPPNGLEAGTAAANALWREIGVLGAEIRAAAPLLVTSCPAPVTLQPSTGVWARALLARADTLVLIVVNDQYYNDQAGCHYTPVSNATVTATLPAWLLSPSAFEISASGLSDVGAQLNGSQLQLNLGTLSVTKMIVLSTSPQLRPALQQRYDQSVRPGICVLAPEFCVGNPPSITQQPSSQSVAAGGTASFTIIASGTSPLSFQWKFNGTNLAGASASAFSIPNVQSNNAGQYSVAVTNAYGVALSSNATLTVLISNAPPTITTQPLSQTVNQGGNATFLVGATGTTPLDYQWHFNGSPIAGATLSAYTRFSVQSTHAGSYTALVTNVAGSVTSAVATLTVNSPPAITAQPQGQTVYAGTTVVFNVTAAGATPLYHHWQKNNVNLSNGGHYSGAPTPTLTITGVDNNDVANYRCVVTNLYGSVTSSVAALTLVVPCAPGNLVDGDFEGGYSGGVANGWTPYQRPPNPSNTVWSIQTASPPGGLQYQRIANSSSAGGAGVRQNVTGCAIGATYRISGWMRGNSVANATCTVKVSPSASTDWTTATNLNPHQTYAGPTWTPFSGTVVATGTNMTLWLDGQTGGTGQFKAQDFDSVTVTCESPPPPLRFDSVALLPGSQVRLVLSGPAGGGVTLQRSSNLVDWLLVTNLVNANGTLQFNDTVATNVPQRFYRTTSP